MQCSSRSWPRGSTEDSLIPDYIVRTRDLDPLPLREADERDYATILAATPGSVTLSWARRDANGRELGISHLVDLSGLTVQYFRRDRIPSHALSEADRLLARPREFATTERAIVAARCWANWHRPEVTAHDGLVRPDHPLILEALGRVHSANSLRRLLRDPLGFVWSYALGFDTSEYDDEPITLDARQIGNLVHDVLRRTLEALELEDGGIAAMSAGRIGKAVDFAAYDAGAAFAISQPVPPPLIWSAAMREVVDIATGALTGAALQPLPGQKSYAEVPFGGGARDDAAPWDTTREVLIPGTGIRISGRIDRLDISADGRARVTDYKTGKAPKNEEMVISGGSELQRCLYGYATQVLLPGTSEIEAGLFYPRKEVYMPLPDVGDVLERLASYLNVAWRSLASGKALPGADAGSEHNDLLFALPANAAPTYLRRKQNAVIAALGDATEIWSAN